MQRDESPGHRGDDSMLVRSTRIAIVGGGLSGLVAAYLLDRAGLHDWVVLEARAHLGGRILSVPASAGSAPARSEPGLGVDRVDLGPTWFWPEMQPQLDRLVADLGLRRFEQFGRGDTLVERSPHQPVARMRGDLDSPASMRLEGGMGALVDALSSRLDPARLVTGGAVRRLRSTGTHVELDTETATGALCTWHVDQVLLAMPPGLAAQTLDFTPALPASLLAAWQETPTWMAPHAKYVAVYDSPFWRDAGLSGGARSACGPLAEIHDACMPGGSAALFGFVGVPAPVRRSAGEAVLRAHCRAQLGRLFGPAAATPRAEFLKDWAGDPHTATARDLEGGGHHAVAPAAAVSHGPWRGRLTGIASEWSPRFAGYLAGCLEAASLGIVALSR